MKKTNDESIVHYADMFTALGSEPRLQIVRLLLAAHPKGLVVSEIQSELQIPASSLSHHLEQLKHRGLVAVQRESTFLRYSANAAALQDLLAFLFLECCTSSKAVNPDQLLRLQPMNRTR